MANASDNHLSNDGLEGTSLLIQSQSGDSTSNLHGTTYIWDDGLQVGDQSSNSQAPLTVYGAATLYGDVTIGTSNQQAALQGNLSVYGATTLYDSLTVDKNQPARLLGSLDVYGTTALHDNLTVDKDQATMLYGSLDVYETTTLRGGLTVGQDQPTTLHGPLTVDASQLTTLGNLTLKGQLTLQASLPISAFSSDTSLSPGDKQTVPTQLAVKTYVNSQISQIDQALSQKAALAGSASQDFNARNLTATGSIGIGANNPLRQLQIGDDVGGIGFAPADASPNAGYVRFGDGTGWKLHVGRSREIAHGAINTGTTGVLMTIQDNGYVGIGTTTPQYPLHVFGAVPAWVNYPGQSNYPGSSLQYCGLFVADGGGAAALGWHQVSDARIKANPTPVEPMCSLATLADLTLYEYEYTPEYQPSLSGQKYHGFLAQEVEKVIPAAVSIIGDHTISDGQVIEGLRVVAHDRIFGEAVGAIQALHAMLQQQEARIRELEER
jgi:hypothetical protein